MADDLARVLGDQRQHQIAVVAQPRHQLRFLPPPERRGRRPRRSPLSSPGFSGRMIIASGSLRASRVPRRKTSAVIGCLPARCSSRMRMAPSPHATVKFASITSPGAPRPRREFAAENLQPHRLTVELDLAPGARKRRQPVAVTQHLARRIRPVDARFVLRRSSPRRSRPPRSAASASWSPRSSASIGANHQRRAGFRQRVVQVACRHAIGDGDGAPPSPRRRCRALRPSS